MFDNFSKVTQGSVGLGHAIAHFVTMGYVVSLPLLDNQDYDVIIDENDVLKKIQIKTSGSKDKNGNYIVQLKSVRANRTRNNIKLFNPDKIDYLFILTGSNEKYLIPTKSITNTCAITLNEDRKIYKVI